MEEEAPNQESRVNPLVRDLLSAGGDKVLAIDGFLGPATEGRVRVYANLRLGTYIELPESDVVRIVDAEKSSDPSTVYFRRDAEVTYVQSATMRAEQALAAAAAAPAAGQLGCGCGSGRRAATARQRDDGPVVDICAWACVERLRLCEARTGGSFWCYFSYAFCRLGCIDPPIIIV